MMTTHNRAMPSVPFLIAIVAVITGSWASSANAAFGKKKCVVSVTVKNTSSSSKVLAGLMLYSVSYKFAGIPVPYYQTVLDPTDPADDLTIPAHTKTVFTRQKNGKCIKTWKSKHVTWKTASAKTTMISTGDGTFPILEAGVDLYVSICTEPLPTFPESTSITVTAGVAQAPNSIPGAIFSTTPFNYVDADTCTLDGSQTEYTGSVTVIGSYFLGRGVPAASTWGYLLMGLLVAVTATLAIRGRRMRAAGG